MVSDVSWNALLYGDFTDHSFGRKEKWQWTKRDYQFANKAAELLRHVLWRRSLQHQQHLPVQGLVQRGGHVQRGGELVGAMRGLQEHEQHGHK